MSKFEKLLKRFSERPSDFTFDELRTLLSHLGYEELKKGRTAGSRAAFFHPATKHIIRLHRPHPRPVLKHYQMEEIYDELQRKGVLETK
jgi:hypothetical protein